MDARVVAAGVFLGFFFASTAMLGGGITGFSVLLGQDTMNLNLMLNDSGVVPLSLPANLTSMHLEGRYRGSDGVTVHLVSPTETFLLATYSTPRQGSPAVMLGEGGTVVELREEDIVFDHTFSAACEETCEAAMNGPFYLQVAVAGGNVTLSSVSYTAATLFVEPEEPDNVTGNETVPPPERPVEAPAHENAPTECSLETACGSGLVCHVGYCISETGHLNVTDKDGRVVALFDKFGKILLAGSLNVNSEAQPPNNSFRMETVYGPSAWVTNTGEFHLRGVLYEQVAELPTAGTGLFTIRNTTDNVTVLHGYSGNLYTRAVVVENVLE